MDRDKIELIKMVGSMAVAFPLVLGIVYVVLVVLAGGA